MTIKEALQQSDISTLDAEVLMSVLLQKDRSWLLIHDEEPLSATIEEKWNDWSKRRSKAEPVAYIIGEKEFYGRVFHVNPDVLIPRPSTEILIDHVKDYVQNPIEEMRSADTDVVTVSTVFDEQRDANTIVDIGTGSGCIAITLALELPNVHIIATDVSEQALATAKKNAEKFGVEDRIDFHIGDCLQPIQNLDTPFIVVTNPPYIPEQEEIMKDVFQYEPHSALFGGKCGDDIVNKLVSQTTDHPLCRGLVMECRREQIKHSISD